MIWEPIKNLLQYGSDHSVVEVADGRFWALDGREVGEKALAAKTKARVPQQARLPTLAGLVKFAATEPEALGIVVGYDVVALWAPRDELNDLSVLASCTFTTEPLTVGQCMSADQMLAQIKARVVPSDNRDELIAAIGATKLGTVTEVQPTAYGSRLTIKSGDHTNKLDLPGSFELRSQKTFPEVCQPLVRFTLHVTEATQGGAPAFELREADGGAWRHQACETIAMHLKVLLEAEGLDLPVFA